VKKKFFFRRKKRKKFILREKKFSQERVTRPLDGASRPPRQGVTRQQNPPTHWPPDALMFLHPGEKTPTLSPRRRHVLRLPLSHGKLVRWD